MKTELTLGSLFDGIAGFPLAAVQTGIKPLWASEIEENCVDITEKNFPEMKQLGDITKIKGKDLHPVDIISFGSPCQNLSVAGDGTGLAGRESQLFFEAIRIIEEMRYATNGKYPKYAVWENVAGAFSSNKGQDFRRVLEEIAKTDIPMPNSGRWATAGMVRSGGGVVRLGDNWTLNTGEFPSEENESILSEILEQNVPEKFFLSAKVCWAMLQRAEDMKRDMPDKLRIALLEVIAEEWNRTQTGS